MNRNLDPAKKNEQILSDLLKIESNKYCADCGQKGTRWASWNIGVFLCIRCGGLHRSLGTHISKVKSVTLDKWTDEQVESIKSKGNAKVNMIYNPISDRHPFPSFSGDMENFIRDKYERKLFIDNSSSGTNRMSLNDNFKNNLIDSEISMGTSESFKNSPSDFSNSSFNKQLTLLSEMGFTDTEFNYKILKASNGNMQEALEIIVASNNKQRRKTVEKNIFDEIEESKPPISSDNTEKTESNISFKAPMPLPIDDWGFDATLTSEKKHSEDLLIEEKIENLELDESAPTPANNKQPNPWDDNIVEKDQGTEKDTNIIHDPFDTYKAFKSNTDSYFDNPW